jgi:hypothetical protein
MNAIKWIHSNSKKTDTGLRFFGKLQRYMYQEAKSYVKSKSYAQKHNTQFSTYFVQNEGKLYIIRFYLRGEVEYTVEDLSLYE